jgi:hypothetical protein
LYKPFSCKSFFTHAHLACISSVQTTPAPHLPTCLGRARQRSQPWEQSRARTLSATRSPVFRHTPTFTTANDPLQANSRRVCARHGTVRMRFASALLHECADADATACCWGPQRFSGPAAAQAGGKRCPRCKCKSTPGLAHRRPLCCVPPVDARCRTEASWAQSAQRCGHRILGAYAGRRVRTLQ